MLNSLAEAGQKALFGFVVILAALNGIGILAVLVFSLIEKWRSWKWKR